MNRALGVGDTAGSDSSVVGIFLCGSQSCLDISEIVKGIEDTDNIDTILYRELNELLNNVVVVVLVTQKVLASQQHLQTCIGEILSQSAKSLPGVLIQITKT